MKNRFFKKIVFILFLLIGVNSFGQDENSTDIAEVKVLTEKMFEDTNNRDFDALLDASHPKLFEIVSKEQMKQVLKSTLEGNEEYSIEIPKIEPVYKLSKVFEEENDNLKYVFISYEMKMKMTFNNQEFDNESKEMMKLMMEGKGIDVEFISKSSLKMLIKNSIVIALKESATDNKWVMINYDADSPIMYRLLPTFVLESAKKYKQNLMLESKKKTEKLESTQKN